MIQRLNVTILHKPNYPNYSDALSAGPSADIAAEGAAENGQQKAGLEDQLLRYKDEWSAQRIIIDDL